MLGYTIQRGEQLTLDVDVVVLSVSSESDQQTNKHIVLFSKSTPNVLTQLFLKTATTLCLPSDTIQQY